MGESSTQISDDFSKHLEAEVQSSKCHINASVSRLLKEIEKLNGNNGKMDKKPRKPAKKRQSKKCKILNTKLDPMCNQTPTVESPTLPRIPSSEWVYQTPKRQRIKRCAVLSALSESEWIEAVRLDTTEETISITTTTSQSGYNTTFEESNTDIVSDVRKYINSSTDSKLTNFNKFVRFKFNLPSDLYILFYRIQFSAEIRI